MDEVKVSKAITESFAKELVDAVSTYQELEFWPYLAA